MSASLPTRPDGRTSFRQSLHFVIAGLALLTSIGCAAETPAADNALVTHALNAERGREIFVSKGCVICHAVNGIGGKAAPNLDAQTEFQNTDPLEFAARMWRGAPAMVELQSLELGYTIWLEASDIADLAAFSASAEEQGQLTFDSIPQATRDSFLDEQFWEVENWGEFLKSGQESGVEPEDE